MAGDLKNERPGSAGRRGGRFFSSAVVVEIQAVKLDIPRSFFPIVLSLVAPSQIRDHNQMGIPIHGCMPYV
jgi:hypothetical protein